MAARSSCPIVNALDVVGDPWTLVVLRDILLGGRRSFSEMAVPERIATNTLTDRLKRLTAAGVLEVRPDPNDGRRRQYVPTERGVALIPVLMELFVWGHLHTEEGTAKADLVAAYVADKEGTLAALTEAALR